MKHIDTHKSNGALITRETLILAFIHAVTSDIGNCVGVDTKGGRWHHKQLSSSGQWWQLSQCVWSPWDLLGQGMTLLPPPFHVQGVFLACTLRVTVIKNNMVKTLRAE